MKITILEKDSLKTELNFRQKKNYLATYIFLVWETKL
jgi:hypothetical protein